MRAHFLLATGLLAGIASCQAGTATGQFNVQVNLNGASSNICTSTSGAAIGGTAVEVQCNSNVYVAIAQVKAVSTTPASQKGRFATSFRPIRDTPLPDNCRTEATGATGLAARASCGLNSYRAQADDSVAETDQGWTVEGRVYAVESNDTPLGQTLARLRLRNSEGTLTALRLAPGNSRLETVEMLVSF
jgi:hypothetical protein